MADTFSIKVKHSVTAHEEDALNETGYLLTYEILENHIEDLPLELFLFKRVLSQRTDQAPDTYKDEFITVCTISDIFEYPANEPDCDHNMFRKAQVKLILPDMNETNRVTLMIEDLLTSLLRSVKLIQTTATEVTRIIKV